MANKKYLGAQVLGTLTMAPPPPPPPAWTPRVSWPFNNIGTRGRALYGCWSSSRSRFTVVGYANDPDTAFPIGDFVAISDNNGVTWSPRTMPWNITYPGNLAIGRSDSQDRTIVGGQAKSDGSATHLAYSDDGGETWIYNPVVITGSFPNYVTFPTDIFSIKWIEEQNQWILGCGNVATSPDGITWTPRLVSLEFRVGGSFIYDIAYSPIDDRIVICNGSHIATSDDAGITWILRTTPFDMGNIQFVKWCPSISKFIAGENDGHGTRSIMFSDDGITWVNPILQTNDPGYINGTQHLVFSVLDLGPQIVAAPFGLDIKHPANIKVSNDGGITWTNSRNFGGLVLSFVLGDGVALALGGYGTGIYGIMTSPIPVPS